MAIKILVQNRKAHHNYTLTDRTEAGIALQGTEVKSLRQGKGNLTDGWVDITDGQATLRDVHIGLYSHGNIMNHTEKRPRRLLLHAKEIVKLEQKLSAKGFSLVPIKIYFRGQFIKVEIALAKGKKLHDKRESTKKKQADREMSRALKDRNR